MDDLRILIADSSTLYKQMFPGAIKEVVKDASVTSVASSDAAHKIIKQQDFDIVIIDAELPGDGLSELIKVIIKDIPKAFVLVTARPSQFNEKLFSEALSLGAAECMIKPVYDSYGANFNIITTKMREVIRQVQTDRADKDSITKSEPIGINEEVKHDEFTPEIVLIAASTGGPFALESIIPKLSKDFPVPILLVQHMPASFTENMAHNLNNKSQINVKVAEHREDLTSGTVYIAPGGTHMKLGAKNKIRLDDSPPIHGVRPAADVLFESVAEHFKGSKVLVIVLTGMGSDGKDGLVALKDKKDCFCLAQSERTCVVYGMPRAVVEEGLADKVLDIEMIMPEIESFEYQSEKSL